MYVSLFVFRTIRYAIVSFCLFLLVFFWSIPVVIVSSMVSLQALQERFSFLEGGNYLTFNIIVHYDNLCALRLGNI